MRRLGVAIRYLGVGVSTISSCFRICLRLWGESAIGQQVISNHKNDIQRQAAMYGEDVIRYNHAPYQRTEGVQIYSI